MKMVVAQEVERFICKPHLPARAVYYGIVFLNQIVLSHRPELGAQPFNLLLCRGQPVSYVAQHHPSTEGTTIWLVQLLQE